MRPVKCATVKPPPSASEYSEYTDPVWAQLMITHPLAYSLKLALQEQANMSTICQQSLSDTVCLMNSRETLW